MDRAYFSDNLVDHSLNKLSYRTLTSLLVIKSMAVVLNVLMAECICISRDLYS